MRTITSALILSLLCFTISLSLAESSKESGINSKMRRTKFIQLRQVNQSSNITNSTNSTINGTNSTNSSNLVGSPNTTAQNPNSSNITTSLNSTNVKSNNVSVNVTANQSNGMYINFAYSLLFLAISLVLL